MPTRKHRASDYLKTPEDIVAYLNAAMEEWDDDPRLLMKAFRNVAEARGGVSELAPASEIGPSGALPRTLRQEESPTRHPCESSRRVRCQAEVRDVK